MKLGVIQRATPRGVARLSARARLSQMATPARADWWAACPADGDPLGNYQFGNCVPVADYQTMRARRANAMGDSWKPTTSDAIARYARLTGFDLTTGANDNGTDTVKDMVDWATKGISTNQALDIIHWVTVDPQNDNDLAIGIAHLGPVQVTLALPLAAQNTGNWARSPETGADWEISSWGYHRVSVGAFEGRVRVARTWGKDVAIHPEFWNRYVTNVDAGISWQWLDTTGLSPSGLNKEELHADLQRISLMV